MNLENLKERMLGLRELHITAGDVRKTSLANAKFHDNCHCHVAQSICRTLGVSADEQLFWAGNSDIDLVKSPRSLDMVAGFSFPTYDYESFKNSYDQVKKNPDWPDDHIIVTLPLTPTEY